MANTEIVSTAVVGRDAREPGTALAAGERIIAGYELQDCIGVGGYGEVWRAIGPGGFPKAVKILFGKVDGPQAETEMKSRRQGADVGHDRIHVSLLQDYGIVGTAREFRANGCSFTRFSAIRL